MNLELLDLEAVKNRKFRVVVDSINSVGGVILPKLLDRLGVEYKFLNGEATGDFAHNPEPIAANLTGIMDELPRVVMIWVSLLTQMSTVWHSFKRMVRCMVRSTHSSQWQTISSSM